MEGRAMEQGREVADLDDRDEPPMLTCALCALVCEFDQAHRCPVCDATVCDECWDSEGRCDACIDWCADPFS